MTESLAIVPHTLGEVQSLAEILAKATTMPEALRGKVPDVIVAVLTGQELGLSPMASIRGIYVVQGKPILSADMMVAVVLGSGKAQYFDRVESSETSVTYETLRVGSKNVQRCTWTIAMAKAAALDKKDNWRAYPRSMLAARAKAELARDVYPDVLAGCYDPDEIERPSERREPTRHAETDVIDAEYVDVGPELAAIDQAPTIEALKALAPSLAKLSIDAKTVAKARYQARLDVLRAEQPPVTNGVNAAPAEAAP